MKGNPRGIACTAASKQHLNTKVSFSVMSFQQKRHFYLAPGYKSPRRHSFTWNHVVKCNLNNFMYNLNQSTFFLLSKKYIWKCRLQNDSHVVRASMCYPALMTWLLVWRIANRTQYIERIELMFHNTMPNGRMHIKMDSMLFFNE